MRRRTSTGAIGTKYASKERPFRKAGGHDFAASTEITIVIHTYAVDKSFSRSSILGTHDQEKEQRKLWIHDYPCRLLGLGQTQRILQSPNEANSTLPPHHLSTRMMCSNNVAHRHQCKNTCCMYVPRRVRGRSEFNRFKYSHGFAPLSKH